MANRMNSNSSKIRFWGDGFNKINKMLYWFGLNQLHYYQAMLDATVPFIVYRVSYVTKQLVLYTHVNAAHI